MGHWLAPIFAPLGFDDWRIPTALITGFSAKEAVVSTLGVLTGTSMETLGTALTGLFTPLSAISFLVFTLLYTPCMAAIAAVKRELGSGVLAGCVVVLQCVVAWAAAFACCSEEEGAWEFWITSFLQELQSASLRQCGI